MKKFKSLSILLGGFLTVIGASAVNLCIFPNWHNEAKMPDSIRNKLQ